MVWVATATIGAAVIGGVVQSKAAKTAARAQTQAADAGIAEQRRQFEAVQKLLSPYIQTGETALARQGALIGLAGDDEQAAAIQRLEQGPEFEALTRQGEDAMLQNAAATGGLRGGNTQAALAQFRPQVLSSLIEQQYGRLGGLSQMGQASAAGVGAAGMQTGANVSNLLQQQGAAQAGSALATGQAFGNVFGQIGQYGGLVATGAVPNPFAPQTQTLPAGQAPTTSIRPMARPF